MGVPAGHPFFGNQYINGDYIRGTYSYVVEKGIGTINTFSNEVSQAVTHVATKQKPVNLIPTKFFSKVSFDDIILIGIILAAFGRIINDELRRNKEYIKQDSLLTIKLQNVGTCIHCGEPLIDSKYVPENEQDAHKAYIICKKCGEKNFARYTDENDSEASNSDE